MAPRKFSRREFARLSAAAVAAAALPLRDPARARTPDTLLDEVSYGDVSIDSPLHQAQLENTQRVLMSLSEDSLLRPFRQMVGQPAPGDDLGGWYNYDPNFDWHKDDAGFAP
jgi:hypothetical protein